LPDALRTQIVHIWREAIGPFYVRGSYDMSSPDENNAAWTFIHDTVAREHGVFTLTSRDVRLLAESGSCSAPS
jgi:hypothetical protein